MILLILDFLFVKLRLGTKKPLEERLDKSKEWICYPPIGLVVSFTSIKLFRRISKEINLVNTLDDNRLDLVSHYSISVSSRAKARDL